MANAGSMLECTISIHQRKSRYTFIVRFSEYRLLIPPYRLISLQQFSPLSFRAKREIWLSHNLRNSHDSTQIDSFPLCGIGMTPFSAMAELLNIIESTLKRSIIIKYYSYQSLRGVLCRSNLNWHKGLLRSVSLHSQRHRFKIGF